MVDSSTRCQDYRDPGDVAEPGAPGDVPWSPCFRSAASGSQAVCRTPDSIDQRAAQLVLVRGGLAAGERVRLPVLTGSMTPLIPAGAVVEVEPHAAGRLPREGEVVVFRQADRLVAHRVLLACPLPSPGWCLQRGDGVSEWGLVRTDDLLGRVVAVAPPHGPGHDLTTPAARREGLRAARRSLRRLVRELVVGPRQEDAP